MKKSIHHYFNNLKKIFNKIDFEKIAQIVKIINVAYKNDHQIFIIGNGGSASTASHFCCDLSKGILGHKGDNPVKRIKAISLTDNMALISAWANDTSYENIFVEQLKNLLKPNDVLIGISASGNSQNIIRAIKYANKQKAITIGFLGFDGGALLNLVNYSIVVKENHYGRVEDVHLILAHLISELITPIKEG